MVVFALMQMLLVTKSLFF